MFGQFIFWVLEQVFDEFREILERWLDAISAAFLLFFCFPDFLSLFSQILHVHLRENITNLFLYFFISGVKLFFHYL